MKKRLFVALAVAGLMAAMLPGLASASITDGRPGQYELRSLDIDDVLGNCASAYVDVVNSNTFISDGGGGDVDITVQENKKFVHATCRFTDTSGIYEANAEVGYIEDGCRLRFDSPVQRYLEGDGRVVAAANNAADGSDGGNVTIKCTFEK